MPDKQVAIQLEKGSIATVVQLSRQIPEFQNPHAAEEYEKRLAGRRHLILIAYEKDSPVGFKVGYERTPDTFYSWMGGVLPTHRRLGIAQRLAETQETWAKEQGFSAIQFKTWNKHRAMLLFAIGRGFSILGVEPQEQLEDYRILLIKSLR